MQGIVTPSPRKDFQPPLGIFLPSTEKQIILLEKNIILLGKIPVSYAIRTKAWYEKYQYWYKKYQTLVEKVPHLEFCLSYWLNSSGVSRGSTRFNFIN